MTTDVITKRIKVEISADGYSAYVVAVEPDLLPADIQNALATSGVIFGLDPRAPFDALNAIGQPVLAASGTHHVDGSDGRIEINLSHERTPAEIKFGITNIREGEIFGAIVKPTNGSAGLDVFGRQTRQQRGKPALVLAGQNIKQIDTDDRIKLAATADGNLKISNSSVEIVPEYIIHGDIEYSDGDLEFVGTLKVLGDVKGNCRLKVGHNLCVEGSVEDASIMAGGDAVIKGSFVGRGYGLIRAAGNVSVHVILNQTIEAGGSITITKESVNAHLIASDSIEARAAIIMGGTVTAANKIQVRTLGGELYSTTRVRLGMRELVNEELAAINKDIELHGKVTAELKSEMYTLVRDKINGNAFDEEKAERLKALQDKLREQNDIIAQLKKKDVSALEVNRKQCPKLSVLGTIHQSVTAEIRGVRLPLKQSYTNVVFEESNNEIIRTRNL